MKAFRSFGSLLLIVNMVLLFVSVANSQEDVGVIYGKLTDKQLDKPIGNHVITLNINKAGDVTQQEITTNETGEYRFENLQIDVETHYTLTTTYNGFDYQEKNLVLSSFVPNLAVNMDVAGVTDDISQIRIRSYTIVLGFAPEDHPHDGALSVIEAFDVENISDMLFQTTHNDEKVGIYLSLPNDYEEFEPRAPESLKLNTDKDYAILTEPLSPGLTQFGFTYIIHGKGKKLDLARTMQFHTDEISVFVPEGINLVPNPKLFQAIQRQQIHTAIYTIYQAKPVNGFSIGKEVDIGLEIPIPESNTSSNVGQLVFIAIAAALAGAFLAAAIFTMRRAKNKPAETDTSEGLQHESGWLRKLNDSDLEHAHTTRLELIAMLDELKEKNELSERVYNRLRKEQTERLTEILNTRKERSIDE